MSLELVASFLEAVSTFISGLLLFVLISLLRIRKEKKVRKALIYFTIALFVHTIRIIYVWVESPYTGFSGVPKFLEFITLTFAFLGTYKIYMYKVMK